MSSSPEVVSFGMSVHPQGVEQDNMARKNSWTLTPHAKFTFQAEVPVKPSSGLVFNGGMERAKCPYAGHSPNSSLFNAEARRSVFNTEPWRRFLRDRMQAAAAPFREAVVTGSGSANGA
jgi:hypothetical protein